MSDWTMERVAISNKLAEEAMHGVESTYYLAVCEIEKLRAENERLRAEIAELLPAPHNYNWEARPKEAGK